MKKPKVIPTLDLHGHRHMEVESLVCTFLNELMLSKHDEAKIITGHSDQMKKIVSNILEDYKIRYIIGDITNKGYIKLEFWDDIL